MRAALGFVLTAAVVVAAIVALARVDLSSDDDGAEAAAVPEHADGQHPPPPQFADNLIILFLQAKYGGGPFAPGAQTPAAAASPGPWQQVALARYLMMAGLQPTEAGIP